ncbi:MAG TPA: hypothetical protein ENI13_00060 [candidate division CPR3 bacterium]|uniref:Uncharacterized protein n=1 Tax=candidate division CPR3 bacterium TaxID=2268181 RepID=A0A7C1SPJ2_UNCC3|nr:hypothetical protein [candidate division CPR3 bacterium]
MDKLETQQSKIKKLEIYKKSDIQEITKTVQVGLPSKALVIKTKVDLEEAKTSLETIKGYKKRLKDWKDVRIKPVNDVLRQLRDDIRPIEDMLTEAEGFVKGALLKYKQEQDELAEEKRKEIAEKVKSGEMSVEKAATDIQKVEQKTEGIKTRTDRVMVIVDPAKVPKKYWVIDEVSLRTDALAADKLGQEIAGVKVEDREITVN